MLVKKKAKLVKNEYNMLVLVIIKRQLIIKMIFGIKMISSNINENQSD